MFRLFVCLCLMYIPACIAGRPYHNDINTLLKKTYSIDAINARWADNFTQMEQGTLGAEYKKYQPLTQQVMGNDDLEAYAKRFCAANPGYNLSLVTLSAHIVRVDTLRALADQKKLIPSFLDEDDFINVVGESLKNTLAYLDPQGMPTSDDPLEAMLLKENYQKAVDLKKDVVEKLMAYSPMYLHEQADKGCVRIVSNPKGYFSLEDWITLKLNGYSLLSFRDDMGLLGEEMDVHEGNFRGARRALIVHDMNAHINTAEYCWQVQLEKYGVEKIFFKELRDLWAQACQDRDSERFRAVKLTLFFMLHEEAITRQYGKNFLIPYMLERQVVAGEKYQEKLLESLLRFAPSRFTMFTFCKDKIFESMVRKEYARSSDHFVSGEMENPVAALAILEGWCRKWVYPALQGVEKALLAYQKSH